MGKRFDMPDGDYPLQGHGRMLVWGGRPAHVTSPNFAGTTIDPDKSREATLAEASHAARTELVVFGSWQNLPSGASQADVRVTHIIPVSEVTAMLLDCGKKASLCEPVDVRRIGPEESGLSECVVGDVILVKEPCFKTAGGWIPSRDSVAAGSAGFPVIDMLVPPTGALRLEVVAVRASTPGEAAIEVRRLPD